MREVSILVKEGVFHTLIPSYNCATSSELFNNISEKISLRPGGYTRIIKTGYRLGDNAEMCIIELVDYNSLLLEEVAPQKKSTRRRKKIAKSNRKSFENFKILKKFVT